AFAAASVAVIAGRGVSAVVSVSAAAVAVVAAAVSSVVGSSTAGKSQLQTTQSFKDGSAVSISTANIVPVESDDFED
ncbi:hypothetical protein OSL60_29460, partial [Escherichia coli]|nr:hypothetical protein [Escherichia coli]